MRTRMPRALGRTRWPAALAWAFTTLFILLNGVYVAVKIYAPTRWDGTAEYLQTWTLMEYGPQMVGFLALPLLPFILAAVHMHTAPQRQAFSLAALVFGAGFITIVWTLYFVQLAWLVPQLRAASASAVEVLAFRNTAGLGWALDVAGWSFSGLMGVALSFVFGTTSLETRMRWLFLLYGIANLLLFPWLLLGWEPLGIPIIVSWLLVLPAATGHLALWFARRDTWLQADARV